LAAQGYGRDRRAGTLGQYAIQVLRAMARLLCSAGILEARLLKSILESEGISCFVKKESCVPIAQLPSNDAWPELWLLDDRQVPQAMQLLQRYHSAQEDAASWRCPACGETVPPQLAVCWKCLAERDTGPDLSLRGGCGDAGEDPGEE